MVGRSASLLPTRTRGCAASSTTISRPVRRRRTGLGSLAPPDAKDVPTLADLGFRSTNLAQLQIPTGASGGRQLFEDFKTRIDRYDEARNFPAVRGPSYLSVHLRFGTVSVRELVRYARSLHSSGAMTWLSELIWRDFYQMILWHHPHVAERAFRPEYDAIQWETGPAADAAFAAWCNGRTGYPLVDAAMAQINETGYMHNRLRMVVASFLTKDLGIDWRRGEHYFAQHLNDFDLAANNGGWQWAASTGCDAQPYFRIFNPVTQSEKFDPEGAFIRRYLPQARRVQRQGNPCAVARQRRAPARGGMRDRCRLPGTHRRSRRGAQADAGTICSGEALSARCCAAGAAQQAALSLIRLALQGRCHWRRRGWSCRSGTPQRCGAAAEVVPGCVSERAQGASFAPGPLMPCSARGVRGAPRAGAERRCERPQGEFARPAEPCSAGPWPRAVAFLW